MNQNVEKRVRLTKSRWTILWVLLLGNFAAGIVFTLLSIAREQIAAELGSTSSVVTWAFTAPTLAGAVAGPALGRYGDGHGHRRLYLVSVFGGIVSSGLVASSWSVGTLIFFRTAAAFFGAAIGPCSLALLYSVFAAQERIKAMGYWSLVGAGSPVIGVLIGGPIIERYGWRVMFVGQMPLFALAFVLGLKLLPDTPRLKSKSFDFKGSALLGSVTLLLLLVINRGSLWGFSDPRILAGAIAVPILFKLFVRQEKIAPSPLIPLGLIRKVNVWASVLSQSLAQFAYLGAGLFLLNDMLVDKNQFSLSISTASRLTISRPIAFAVVAPLAGMVAIRIGERYTATIGMAAILASMVGFSVIVGTGATGPNANHIWLIILLALTGMGMGISQPALATSVANAVPQEMIGTIGAAQQVVVQMGGVIGTVVLSTIAGENVHTVGSYRSAFMVASLVCLIALVLATLIRPLHRTR